MQLLIALSQAIDDCKMKSGSGIQIGPATPWGILLPERTDEQFNSKKAAAKRKQDVLQESEETPIK
jgi:hypothetical protein